MKKFKAKTFQKKAVTQSWRKMHAQEKVINEMMYDNNVMSLIPRFGESAS